MKVMSTISVFIGVLAVLAAVVMMILGSMDVFGNMQAKIGRETTNPYPMLWIAFAVGIIGGFLTGLGISRPRKVIAPIPVPTEPTA